MTLKVKVGMIGALDMLKFKNQTSVREKAIANAQDKEIKAVFASNEKAKLLHPDYQELIITKIKDYPSAQAKSFVLEAKENGTLAFFRAGQYLSVSLEINGFYVSRPYSISSSPSLALRENQYEITVKRVGNGFVSDYILNNWKIGDTVLSSGPLGQFYFEEMRDSKNVVALAGGSGITPFLSMAEAINSGEEDFNLTIIYGCRDLENILFKEELDELSSKCKKIKVVNILSEKEVEGYEFGFITSDIIKKYTPEDYSIFICGPEAMYKFTQKEIEKLNLESKFVRRELMGVTKEIWEHEGYPVEKKGKTFKLKVTQCGKEYSIDASADETMLTALERAGIAAPSHCRSGECGWCHSKLISGEVFIPEENDGRRHADISNNYIHPCSSFLLSDAHIDVPGVYKP